MGRAIEWTDFRSPSSALPTADGYASSSRTCTATTSSSSALPRRCFSAAKSFYPEFSSAESGRPVETISCCTRSSSLTRLAAVEERTTAGSVKWSSSSAE